MPMRGRSAWLPTGHASSIEDHRDEPDPPITRSGTACSRVASGGRPMRTRRPTRSARPVPDMAALFAGEYLYITDNDMIYGVSWFENLVACYLHFRQRHPMVVASCLNVPYHALLDSAANSDRFVEKASIGGASWFCSLETMRTLLPDEPVVYWDHRGVERLRAAGGVIGCTRRSFVQHIG